MLGGMSYLRALDLQVSSPDHSRGVLLHPPSRCSRRFNRDGEEVSAE